MGTNILIVEDQFIEANDLRIILERAGHTICGIAKSVDQALQILKKEHPDIVLLDIFLKGDLTGIDLAKTLSRDNIPFIYLSANSNQSTFEAAKATQPYGFLVKPFRERDILAALDIASYRHKHMYERMQRQESWLSHLLGNIIGEAITQEQKLLLLAKAFKPFLHFEYVFIDLDLAEEGLNSIYGFQRVGYDDYRSISGREFLEGAGLPLTEFNYFRKNSLTDDEISIRNWAVFEEGSIPKKAVEKIKMSYGLQSGLWVPFANEKKIVMSISFYSLQADHFTTEMVELLSPLRKLLFSVLENIRKQKDEPQFLSGDGITFQEEEAQPLVRGIVGKSPNLLQVLDQVTQVAAFDTTVLILGETGAGKEGLANAIHALSNRKHKPLIKVNCAAIPNNLVESELFGHEKGAFTSATDRRIGKFEQAHGGTIFLDEIGEIPLEVQSKLLRVLQEKELERIGGRATIKTDVRIIAATNRNLYKEVAAGKFRIDLYFRINVFPVILPPLRERMEDIPLLVDYFLKKNALLSGDQPKKVTPEVLSRLMSYSWPGNIRELQHLIERYVVITPSSIIKNIDLPDEICFEYPSSSETHELQSIAEIDKAHIVAVLKKCNGKIAGKGGAAEILKMRPTTLNSKMKKLGIAWQYL